jgi:hypothetical protein
VRVEAFGRVIVIIIAYGMLRDAVRDTVRGKYEGMQEEHGEEQEEMQQKNGTRHE